jgi:aldehyde dehydrogenase (NAD+)
MGPVASKAQLEKDESMVNRAVADGAELIFGGKRANPPGLPDGYFFSPTILSNVAPDSYIAQNEVFGPVLSIIPFEDEEEAVAIANGTPFGLAAGVWTLDIAAHRMARQLQAGTVWINMYRAMTFNSPFGGYKSAASAARTGSGDRPVPPDQERLVRTVRRRQDPFVMRSDRSQIQRLPSRQV